MWGGDPLDGTTHYSQGLPTYTVSIGWQHRGQTIIGVVYAPYLDELFYAAQGSGAFWVCAGTLVVQEADGTVVPYRSDRKVSIIAGNGAIVQLIQGFVQ